MKPVLLITANYLREQRWVLGLLVVYVLGQSAMVGGLAGARIDAHDLAFFLKEEAVYGGALAAFIGSAAINNDRRSRRILAVLSKGISRRQYIAGLMGGICFCLAVYFVAMIPGMVLLQRQMQSPAMWSAVGVLAVAAMLVGALALFFSTFMHPLLALVATGIALAVPPALQRVFGGAWDLLLPAYSIGTNADPFSVGGWTVPWTALAAMMMEIVILWWAAGVVFARRDVTVAVE